MKGFVVAITFFGDLEHEKKSIFNRMGAMQRLIRCDKCEK
jgi:hypothetical protein